MNDLLKAKIKPPLQPTFESAFQKVQKLKASSRQEMRTARSDLLTSNLLAFYSYVGTDPPFQSLAILFRINDSTLNKFKELNLDMYLVFTHQLCIFQNKYNFWPVNQDHLFLCISSVFRLTFRNSNRHFILENTLKEAFFIYSIVSKIISITTTGLLLKMG